MKAFVFTEDEIKPLEAVNEAVGAELNRRVQPLKTGNGWALPVELVDVMLEDYYWQPWHQALGELTIGREPVEIVLPRPTLPGRTA